VGARILFSRPTTALARAQAPWIAAMDPWRSLEYRPPALGRYLARKAGTRNVWIARTGPRAAPSAVVVADDGFLLGGFIALLAVRPEASGRGVGRALLERVAAEVFATRRWLFVSCDGNNRAALRFYRKLGFLRVGRLPDLVRPGNVEILLRKSAPVPARPARTGPSKGPKPPAKGSVGQSPPVPARPAGTKFPAGAARVGYHRDRP
jgi:GNAT superfamily N-acetyltransferase